MSAMSRYVARRLLPVEGRATLAIALAAGLALATGLLVLLGFRATVSSQRNVRLLLERREAQQLTLVWAGVQQDMKGAHATVLALLANRHLLEEPPYDLADTFAQGLARFPYPESFFTWRADGQENGSSYVFMRADRPPPSLSPKRLTGPYPVDVVRDPSGPMRDIIAQSRHRAQLGAPLAVFDTTVGDRPYQVVVRYLYSDDVALTTLVGFTVNLDWVQREYFPELVRQLSRIGGDADELSLAVIDDKDQLVTATQPRHADMPALERPFPLLFADRTHLPGLSIEPPTFRRWTLVAAPGDHSTDAAAAKAWNVAFVLIALSAVIVLVGLLMTVSAARTAAQLTTMKSDFVSTVTHELKTPLALIVLVAETFDAGRYDSAETQQHYTRLLSQASRHLTHLVDNLLAYAALSDVRHAYHFESADLMDLLDDALQQFHPSLKEQQFSVTLETPADLPPVRADRASLKLAFDNLIDNAIKYSKSTRVLQIQSRLSDGVVHVAVSDRGMGIPEHELPHIRSRFFRGRGARTRGSGMGLAITDMIVSAHGGRLTIQSTVGVGTTVDVALPAAAG